MSEVTATGWDIQEDVTGASWYHLQFTGDISVNHQIVQHIRTALLTKLRDEVEGQKASMMKHETLYNVREYETGLNIFDGLLALLEKAGE